MAVNRGLSTTISSGTSLYRITSMNHTKGSLARFKHVVDGRGAVMSNNGARYNYPGVATVYLTHDLETCFAEKMFYFQREVVRGIDQVHHTGVVPPFEQTFALWEVTLKNSVNDVADLNLPPAITHFAIFPSLPLNPSQDYDHLKQRRAHLQSQGYHGIIVGSSRATNGGSMVVLFDDQSANVKDIAYYPIDFRLIDINGIPFIDHATQVLDFTAGAVRFSGTAPTSGTVFTSWQTIRFNH